MDIQQIITLALVAAASIYLYRLGRDTWKAMWSARGGCGSGCAKCVTAQIAAHRHAKSQNAIPLSTIQRGTLKRDG